MTLSKVLKIGVPAALGVPAAVLTAKTIAAKKELSDQEPAVHWTAEEEQRWADRLRLRSDVNKALERARGEKLIGKSLDARVTLFVTGAAAELLAGEDEEELCKLCLVSECKVEAGPGEGVPGENVEGLTVHVEPSALPKCLRCWTRSKTVGSDSEHPELCARCAAAIR